MKKIIKRLFCIHEYKDSDRKFGITGYVVKCNKCGKSVGYCKDYDKMISLDDGAYNEYIELFVDKKYED